MGAQPRELVFLSGVGRAVGGFSVHPGTVLRESAEWEREPGTNAGALRCL